MDLFVQLERLQTSLSPSERKVAEAVVGQPQVVLRLSILELAALAGVSEPTIIRFCRKLGCEGFRDFKLILAQNLVSTETYGTIAVTPEDSAADLVSKVFNSTIEKLARIRGMLDHATLEQAIEALTKARKVEFYGLGFSGNIAVDAHHKFFRLGIPCIAYTEAAMQLISAKTLGKKDVVVAISNSGGISELLKSVEVAREAGATVIGITARGSALAKLCSIALTVEPLEQKDVYSPIISRVAHLLVVDTLAVAVALHTPTTHTSGRPAKTKKAG